MRTEYYTTQHYTLIHCTLLCFAGLAGGEAFFSCGGVTEVYGTVGQVQFSQTRDICLFLGFTADGRC